LSELDVLKLVVKSIVLPPAGPLLVALLGIAIARRWRHAGRLLAAAGVLTLFALSMPAIAVWLVETLDTSPPLDPAAAQTAQAIVIPGGGVRRSAAEYGGDTLSTLSLERVRYGARLANSTRLPVLVTGGPVQGGDAEAVLMQRVLEDEFKVPVRWSEHFARSTHENAVYSAALLRNHGITRVILVVHSFDVPRARAEFEAAGLAVVVAPTGIPPSRAPDAPLDFWPSASALQTSYYALYELLAYSVLRMGLMLRDGSRTATTTAIHERR
jgi:uncharacterized SAM-binding protein YcdF (DUF218 family)